MCPLWAMGIYFHKIAGGSQWMLGKLSGLFLVQIHLKRKGYLSQRHAPWFISHPWKVGPDVRLMWPQFLLALQRGTNSLFENNTNILWGRHFYHLVSYLNLVASYLRKWKSQEPLTKCNFGVNHLPTHSIAQHQLPYWAKFLRTRYG